MSYFFQSKRTYSSSNSYSCLFEYPKSSQQQFSPTSMDLDKENKQPSYDNQQKEFAPRFRTFKSRSRHNSNRYSVSSEKRDENNNFVNANPLVQEPTEKLTEPVKITCDPKLNTKWSVYYMQKKIGKNEHVEDGTWANRTHKIAEFDTVTNFWQICNHLPAPHQLVCINDPSIMIFRGDIRPEWEDIENSNGGVWKLTLTEKSLRGNTKDSMLSRLWYELLLTVIGETLLDNPHYMNLVNGVIIARKNREDRIHIWTKDAENADAQLAIGRAIKSCLNLGTAYPLEYHQHTVQMAKKNWSKAADDSKYRLPSTRNFS